MDQQEDSPGQVDERAYRQHRIQRSPVIPSAVHRIDRAGQRAGKNNPFTDQENQVNQALLPRKAGMVQLQQYNRQPEKRQRSGNKRGEIQHVQRRHQRKGQRLVMVIRLGGQIIRGDGNDICQNDDQKCFVDPVRNPGPCKIVNQKDRQHQQAWNYKSGVPHSAHFLQTGLPKLIVSRSSL